MEVVFFRNFLIVAVGFIFFNATIIFANENTVVGLKVTVSQLNSQSALPVIFPTKIPAAPNNQSLYASVSSYGIHPDYNKFWQINVDTTPTCGGVKVCNMGSISAEKNGKLELYYFTLPDKKNHLKERIILKNNVVGYYTPFHIQASGVNPTLEWQTNDILYTLTWTLAGTPGQQKQTLIEMANSAISSASPI